MPTLMRRHRAVCVALAIALAAGMSANQTARAQDAPMASLAGPLTSLAVIVNRENAVTDVSIADLRRIMFGETTRWPDGKKITIALREPGQPERDAVLRLVCRMGETDFSRSLLHTAYRIGAHAGIKELDTSVGVRRFVFNVPGAIGYVRSSEVDSSVKVLHLKGTVPEVAAFGLTLQAQ